jgi:ATP-dependent helicase HrpA
MDGGRELARGKDLDELRERLRPRLRARLADAAADLVRTGLRDWTIGTLPRVITRGEVTAYPALEDTGTAADVRLFETEAQAGAAMVRGTRRLLLLQVPTGLRSIADRLPNQRKLALSRSPYPSIAALLDDCAAAAADQVIADAGGPAWDADGFARLVEAARSALPLAVARVLDLAGQVLEAAHEAESRLRATASPAVAAAFEDARAQFAGLIYPGFVSEAGLRHLPDLVRYLRAISRRLDTVAEDPGRDAERAAAVRRVTEAYRQTVAELPAGRRNGADVRAVRWMIEELRVSLFAQVLGTPGPVSEKRIRTALDRLIEA